MSIKSMLDELDNGNVIQRIDEELSRVVEAVQETHAAGKLTIVLSITDEGMGRAKVEAKVEAKAPTHALAASLFFFGKTPGYLSRENERQGKLAFVGGRKSERVNSDGEVEDES